MEKIILENQITIMKALLQMATTPTTIKYLKDQIMFTEGYLRNMA